MIGRTVTFSDQGDGWFRGCGDVAGTITSVVPAAGHHPYYVVRFEPPLELQEPEAPTPSGLILNRYSYAVIRSRWADQDIGPAATTSVHVALVPTGNDPPETTAQIAMLRAQLWASCVVT